MAEPNEKLARSLEVLRALQRSGRGVIRTSEISRTHRERLTRNGFLWQPLQGWLVPANPGDRDGDSTSWYLSFWEFCAAYCTWRFGAGWHLSAHVSTMIHAGDTAVPHKCIVMAATGSNNAIDLPYDTAIVDVRQAQPREDLIEVIDGLRVLTSFECLVRAPDSLYRTNAVALQVVLSQITEPSDILRHLLAGGHVRPA
ncbi:MAG: cell filamentation protein Fic, partial [Thermoleophilia bacterium]|nr:cell filamentation protein Fic [Thermoleophilia bacterium]